MWIPESIHDLTLHPANAFQISAWNELFDPYTPDSFQPKLLNTAKLVEELMGAADRARTAPLWKKHVQVIKEELSSVAEQEVDLICQLPEYQWRLNLLFKTDKPEEIFIGCKILQANHASYEGLIFSGLRRAAESLPKKKEAALKFLGRLATLAMNSGKAHEEFREVVDSDNLKKAKGELADQLIAGTTLKEQKYECLLLLRGERSSIHKVARKAGFDLLSMGAVLRVIGKSSGSGVTVVVGAVSSISAREAARECAKKIRRAFDVYNLYSNSAALELMDDVYVKSQGDSGHRQLNLGDQTLRKLHARNRCGNLTVKALDLFSSGNGEERLFNALELHSLAHGSAASRVKLINLWSAMECLAGLDPSESVIDRVCRVFSPIIMWRHVEKTVRYITYNLQLLREAGVKEPLGTGFPKSAGSDSVDAWETMATLCKPQCHQDIEQLLRFSAIHPLLCFRVFSMWKQLSNPRQLGVDLLNSKKRIEWQLSRIYRARNMVVHDGFETPSLPALLDNLHYYFSITVSRILHSMMMHPSWGLAESIAHWQAKVGYVLEMLEKQPESLRMVDFFPGDRRPSSSVIWSDDRPIMP